MSIQVLPRDVVNQIAAGEVVERPSHLVKELIENSLDAGSTKIAIEIRDGGRSIQVKDNGSGISVDELHLALEQHATSKIRLSEDLFKLASFGFRGEALSSIAAVSDLNLNSKKNSSDSSYQIHSAFGRVGTTTATTLHEGTEISIQSLFENVPARLKFLKSETTEISQIKSVVKALALAYPRVEFKLKIENELEFIFPEINQENDQDFKNYRQRIESILKVKKVFLRSFTLGDVHCRVAFAAPLEVAKSSKNIWVFVQNRWVQDRTIMAATIDAFRSLLMHGEYPQCAVFVDVPTDAVDVNIHPTKSQVKFINTKDVYRAVQTTLRDALSESPWYRGKMTSNTSQYNVDPRQSAELEQNSFFKSGFHEGNQTSLRQKDFLNLKVSDFDFEHTSRSEKLNHHLSHQPIIQAVIQPNIQPKYWSEFQIIGQFALTYIVCQKDDRLVLVDQHAAHERIAFEKLMTEWKRASENSKANTLDVQTFLFPLTLDMSEEKIEVAVAIQDRLLKMGIEIEQVGPLCLGIKSAPLFLKEVAIKKAIEKMIDDLLEFGDSHSFEKIVGEVFSTLACHSVIRAGQALSRAEMQELLIEMDRYSYSSFCPHGRPVFVDWPVSEIEKLFGRRG